MKVAGNRPITTSATRRTRASSAAPGFRAGGEDAARAPEASAGGVGGLAGGVAGAGPVMGMDQLLALQGGDPDAGRGPAAQAAARAEDLLDALDALKLDLLSGGGGAQAARALQERARSARIAVEDERLSDLLDQIDVRAAVELAKRLG